METFLEGILHIKSFIFLLALPCAAAITSVRITDVTHIEAVLRFVPPGPGTCTIRVSPNATLTPLIHDVDPTLFTNADKDNRNGAQGRERTFVIGSGGIGARYAVLSSGGVSTSRAMEANLNHYGDISCPTPAGGTDTLTFNFRTANIVVGDTFPGTPMPIDPARLGDAAWPAPPWTGTGSVIDPLTGVKISRFRNMNEHLKALTASAFQYAYDGAGGWTNKTNAFVDDTALATVASSDPLRLYTTYIFDKGHSSMLGLTLRIHGFRDASGTTTEACLSIDGFTCFGPWVAFTLPIGALGATVDVGDLLPVDNVSSVAAMFGGWLSANQKLPTQNDTSSRNGTGSNVGAVLTLYSSNYTGAFDPRWTTGTRIVYNGVEYTVASVTSASEITLNTAPPANYTNAAWTSATFGFMIRRSSGTGTVSIDSAVFYAHTFGTYNTNKGSGSIEPCGAKKVPQGWRVGAPGGATGLNYNAATNTAPIKITFTSTANVVVGHTLKVRDVPGNVAANGTWPIGSVNQIAGGTEVTLTGSDGTASGVFPSDATGTFAVSYGGGGIAWDVAASKGQLCSTVDGDGNYNFHWIDTAADPVDIRYQGIWPNRAYDFDSDPDGFPIGYELRTVAGKQELFKGRYIANWKYGMFQDVGTNFVAGSFNDAVGAQFAMASVTPSPNTFTDLAIAFDSTMTNIGFALNTIPKPSVLTFLGGETGTSQNGMGIMGVWNTGTNSMTAIMNTWKNANARWCGLHTFLPWPGADFINWVPYEAIGDDGFGNFGSYNGPYQMVSASGSLNNTTDIGDCATKLAAIGQPNPLGITGTQCSTVVVVSAQPITPAGATPPNDTRNNMAIRVGDSFSVRTATGAPGNSGAFNGERVLLLGKSGTTLVVQRAVETTPIINQGTGFKLNAFCNILPRWWDYTSAPHGETGTDLYSQNLSGNFVDLPMQTGSHILGRSSLFVNDSGGVMAGYLNPAFTCSDPAAVPNNAYYATRSYPWPNHVAAPTTAYGCVKGNPAFDDANNSNFQGQFAEKHPSSVPNKLSGTDGSFTDSRPYLTYFAWQQTRSQLGTYVWKVTNYQQSTGLFDEKRNKLFVALGAKTAYDVSAPGFILPDTIPYNYTYCLTHVAGECRAGSVAGDVYVNVPNVAKQPLGLLVEAGPGTYQCSGKEGDETFNDICVGIQGTYADATVQYPVVHDPYNSGARILTYALAAPRSTGGLWSAPNFPDGDYQVNWTMIANGANRMSMLIKIPPYQGIQRGTNRNSWIPIPVKLATVPSGTSTVTVEYGYNPSFECATRHEICVAVNNTISAAPYYYASDTYTRLSCASGCTPVIPALSQRLMWYWVKYWNGSNALLHTSDVNVMATP